MFRRWFGGATTAILAATALAQVVTAHASTEPDDATPVPGEVTPWSIDPGFVVIIDDRSNDTAFVVRWKDTSNDTGFIPGGGGAIIEPPPATPAPGPATPVASDC